MTQLMVGQADVRPLLETLKKIDPVNLPRAWKQHKEILRIEFSQHQNKARAELAQITAASTIIGGIGTVVSKLFGGRSLQHPREPAATPALARAPNLVDVIESAARSERAAFLKEQEVNKDKLIALQAEHEQKILDHLEENKKKNLKLIDYLMGAGQMQPEPVPVPKE